MKYIVYKTTNLINNKIYVGVHRTNPDIFDGYKGCVKWSTVCEDIAVCDNLKACDDSHDYNVHHGII